MWVSLPDVAARMGVDESRVRRRIEDGSLPGVKIGGRWLIDDVDIAPAMERSNGRPLSARSAWGLVGAACELDGKRLEILQALLPMDRSRARRRLSNLRDELSAMPDAEPEQRAAAVAVRLRNLLRHRARRALHAAAAADLADLRVDRRVVLSGLSDPRSGIASGALVEAYVAARELSGIIEDFLLLEAGGLDANVILHVVDEQGPVSWELVSGALGSPLVLAADLAEHRGPREEAKALDIVERTFQDSATGLA